MTYKKIEPEHPSYKRLTLAKAAGEWMCDAVAHNEASGCSNPTCSKWSKAPKCDCGGEPTFHGHSQRCKHGVWLMSLGWYKEAIGKVDATFDSIFAKPTLKGAP